MPKPTRAPRPAPANSSYLIEATLFPSHLDEVLEGKAQGKAPIEQCFQVLEANPHASVPWEEAKLRLMAPFKLKKAVAATRRREGA